MAEASLSKLTDEPPLTPAHVGGQGLLTEQAHSHFQLLTVLRRQVLATGAASQIGVVATIARWLDAPPLLTLIAHTPPWYAEWEIKRALYANPYTPRRIREEIGHIISIFELMREMDKAGLSEQEKFEIREDIKSLFATLSSTDKVLVKTRAYRLSSKGKTSSQPHRGVVTLESPVAPISTELVEYTLADLVALTEKESSTDEFPALPEHTLPQEVIHLNSLPPNERLTLARTTSDGTLLKQALESDQEPLLEAVLSNPELSESLLLQAATQNSHPLFFRVLAHFDEWYQRPTVRLALLENPHLPPDRKRGLMITEQIPVLFEVIDLGGERAESASQILGLLIDRLSSEDLTYALETVKVLYPHLAHLIFSTPSFTGELTLPPGVESSQVPDAVQEVAVSSARLPVDSSSGSSSQSGFRSSFDQTTSLRQQPAEARCYEAATTTDTIQMAILMTDPSDEVFHALLNNPALPEDLVVGYARSISAERAETMFHHQNWSHCTRFRDVLLDNPQTPHSVSLEILSTTTNFQILVKVLKNPKITSIEVKQTAHHRLVELYQTIDSAERITWITKTKGEILQELGEEAFHDESTIATLLRESSLNEETVLRVVRAKAVPRSALAEIGNHPAWSNHAQIRLELMMNPKTPRETMARLLPLLSPADRARIKTNRSLPDYIRSMV